MPGPEGRVVMPFFRGLNPCSLRRLRITTVVLGQSTMPSASQRRNMLHDGRLWRSSLRDLQPEFAQIAKHAGGPAVDVVFHHMAAHSLHPHAALAEVHVQTLMDGLRDPVVVIRIHQQRIG